MPDLTVNLKCPVSAEKKAAYVLNLIASITGLRFRLTDDKADISYGDADGKAALNIPYIEYNIDLKDWRLANKKSRVILPEFIPYDWLNAADSRMKVDIISLISIFLKDGLENHKNSPWSPEKVGSGSYYIYPFINSHIDIFIQALKAVKLIPENFEKLSPWADNAPFAVALSHDIDIFGRRLWGSCKMLAMSFFPGKIPGGVKGSITGIGDSLKSLVLRKTNPYRMISKWRHFESSATFFIYAGKRKSANDPTYKLEDVRKVFSRGIDLDYEIALHNGIGTWQDKTEINTAGHLLSEVFGVEVNGIRPHYLDCRYPAFWKNAAAFAYSSSVGSDTIPGFTCGINFPFYGFDFETGEVLDILEMPIGMMDGAIFSLRDKTIRERTIDHIIDACNQNHGLLVLDWHNRTNYEPDFPGWLTTYQLILEKAGNAGAYIGSLDDINKWWRKHCASAFLS